MARKLRVWVDQTVCVGNAMCEAIARNTFQLNERRQSEAVNPEGDSVEKILEAAALNSQVAKSVNTDLKQTVTFNY